MRSGSLESWAWRIARMEAVSCEVYVSAHLTYDAEYRLSSCTDGRGQRRCVDRSEGSRRFEVTSDRKSVGDDYSNSGFGLDPTLPFDPTSRTSSEKSPLRKSGQLHGNLMPSPTSHRRLYLLIRDRGKVTSVFVMDLSGAASLLESDVATYSSA